MGVFVKTAEDGWLNLEAGATPDELPGIGGWADIIEITGTGEKYEYTSANGLEWSAWEFTGTTGSFTVGGEEGVIEFLLVSSATRHSGSSGGKGGAVLNGLELIDPVRLRR